jgi:hypothetical protein
MHYNILLLVSPKLILNLGSLFLLRFMKTKLYLFLSFLWSVCAFAQTFNKGTDNNTITVLFDNMHLGVNYHYNLNPYFGLTATTRIFSSATSYDFRSPIFDPIEYPDGQYIHLNEYAFRPSIASVQPDFIHPNGNHFGARIMRTNVLGGIGVFGEKRELIFKRMNFKISAYASMLRVNYIQEQGGGAGFIFPEGPNGEEPFKFTYYHNHYEQYWTKPFVSFDFQLDWRIYKSLHLGVIYQYMPVSFSSHVIWPLGGFSIATRL